MPEESTETGASTAENPDDRSEEPPHISVPIDGREVEGPLVRPFGCHPAVPIVRQIGDRPLFLGNRFAADPEFCDRSFDAVVTVAEEREPTTTAFRPLIDGYDAEWERFRAAVDAVRRRYRDCLATDTDCDSLLVHCKAGISRSNTVIAATIAVEEDRSFAESFDLVRAVRPHAVAHPRLHELAVWYVAEWGDRAPRTIETAGRE